MEEKLTIKQALDLAVKNHDQGKLREAEIIYRNILNKEPSNSDALHLLGLIAYQVGKYENAVRDISQAILLKPNTAIYHGNLGMVYDALGKEEESFKNFKRALEINPEYEGAHLAYYNLSVFFQDKGEIENALEYYNKSIERDNNFAEAHWNKGLILLLLGRFKEGWEEYEYRFKKKKPSDSRVFNKPKWDGSSLKNKKILVISEQGFGDNIQFIRYVPLIKEKGGYVILECKKELRKLFKDFPGVDEFIDKKIGVVPEIDFDFYIHLMSLPEIFKTDLDNIPDNVPYLKTDNELSEKFKEELKSDKFKIGIVWAGNPDHNNDKNRSITFEKFKSLKKIKGIKLFSLQEDESSNQLNDSEIIDMKESINDFADTAAIIDNLDLIISVDTSVAHLAGAIGKPVWTILPFTPDWRWLLNRDDSPWYPGMRLFRQKNPGNWDSVFSEVSKEIRKILDK